MESLTSSPAILPERHSFLGFLTLSKRITPLESPLFSALFIFKALPIFIRPANNVFRVLVLFSRRRSEDLGGIFYRRGNGGAQRLPRVPIKIFDIKCRGRAVKKRPLPHFFPAERLQYFLNRSKINF